MSHDCSVHQTRRVAATVLVPAMSLLLTASVAAQSSSPSASPLAMSYDAPSPQESGQQQGTTAGGQEAGESGEMETKAGARTPSLAMDYGYREVSDFFQIREANANVGRGEWEFEIESGWKTDSDGTDDDIEFLPSLKYGVTDELFVQLEVMDLEIGDGGDVGNGDLALIVFWQFLKETDQLPAMATWAEMRIPSGEGSSGVDGTFHFNVTKSVATNCRAHFEGWVMTANGARGGDDADRRHFQWGLGPGFDYRISDNTLALVNYLMRSSEEFGHHNQNILEFGLAHTFDEHHTLKAAFDVGLDGAEETPNFAAKLLWAIEFGGA